MLRVTTDFRTARLAANLSLRDVARAAGMSHSQVARFEHGELRVVDLQAIGACCAVVGLDLAVRTYLAGDALRDRAQYGLLERLHALLHATLRWLLEVPIGRDGDVRAWDAEIRGQGWRAHVEAETRLTDGQALLRKLALKIRDGGSGPLILLVADTRANREALVTLRPALRELLPLDARPILAALREGREPPGSGIVVL
jgi:transcriptional regulator with XRE-family HTH domain